MQTFVEHDRLAHASCHMRALRQGLARLLDPAAQGDIVQHLDRDGRHPSTVDIVGDGLVGSKGGFNGLNPGDVERRVAAADLCRIGTIALCIGFTDKANHILVGAG